MANLKEPHLFNIGSNPLKVIRNLDGLLTPIEIEKIRREVVQNVIALFQLGEDHFAFAKTIANIYWRQKISRYYYSAYNIRRAVSLKYDGTFATDVSDHKKMDQIPEKVANVDIYRVRLANLREDRNLADYNHLAQESDLVISVADCETLVEEFRRDARLYLIGEGVAL